MLAEGRAQGLPAERIRATVDAELAAFLASPAEFDSPENEQKA